LTREYLSDTQGLPPFDAAEWLSAFGPQPLPCKQLVAFDGLLSRLTKYDVERLMFLQLVFGMTI
jgi:hypothetical protein